MHGPSASFCFASFFFFFNESMLASMSGILEAQIQLLMSNDFTEEEMMNILNRDCCRILFLFLNGLRWFHIYNTNATQPLVYSASLRLSLDLHDDEDMVVETGPGE